MEYSRYTDFLKDPDFINWQLLNDDSLEEYWMCFIDSNPHLKDEIDRAISYLKEEGFNDRLSPEEREELLNRIRASVRGKRKATLYGRLKMTIAASVAVVIIAVVATLFINNGEKTIQTPTEEVIIGELLTSEDVKLLTSNSSMIFENDVEVKLDEKGNAEVIQRNKESTRIDINKDEFNSLIIPYGKRSTVTLSDGSKIWLNSGSILEFPAQFNGNKREIRLASGEIYIEVAHDSNKPFYVHTSDFEVRVLGTSFNISSYDNSNSSVILVEGSVALKLQGESESISLAPNEKAEFNADLNSFNKQNVDVINYISWKDGYLSLDKTAMTDILKTIGRYYNLSFNFDQGVDLNMRTCTGKIYLSDNLDNVLKTFSLLSSTNYKIENNRIYITNEID